VADQGYAAPHAPITTAGGKPFDNTFATGFT